MKRKSLPDMFLIASVLSDDDAVTNLEPPTQVDGMIPSVMKAQLDAALARTQTTKKTRVSTSSLPVIATLPVRVPAAQPAAKRSRMAWIPGVVVVGVAIAAVIGTFRGDAHATAPEAALVQPAAQQQAPAPIDPAVAAALATPASPALAVVAPTADNEVIDIPASVPVTARPSGVVTTVRVVPHGGIAPRADQPRVVAVAPVPQPAAPAAKPAPTQDAPAKGKGDSDYEAALRAAQRANQQLDQTLR